MKSYELSFVVPDCKDIADIAEAVYAIEELDGSLVHSRNSVVYVTTDRESASLESAIAEASALLAKYGVPPKRVEIELDTLLTASVNAEPSNSP